MDPADDFEDDSDIIFDSPPPSITKPKETPVSKESRYSTEEAREAREAALKQELESIRKINQVVEGVVESLEKAKGNMEVCWAPSWLLDMDHGYWFLTHSRLFRKLSIQLQLFFIPGRAFSHRRNTTSV